jgi:hypothetical protein
MGDMRRFLREISASPVRPRKSTQRDMEIPGLIRHYTGDRTSSDAVTIYDETGNGNGTASGYTQGSGVSGLGRIGGNVTSTQYKIDMGGDITFASFSMWIRRLDLAVYSNLICAAADRSMQIQDSGHGNYLYAWTGSGAENSNLVVSDITRWHHVAGVLESGSNLRFYLDGVPASATVNYNTTVMQYIGRRSTQSGQEAVSWDNFRLFTSILSYPQIMWLFNEHR